MARFDDVLICINEIGGSQRLCGNEVPAWPNRLPTWCPRCKQTGKWRFALYGEITAHDRRFLWSLRIKADEDDPQLKVD